VAFFYERPAAFSVLRSRSDLVSHAGSHARSVCRDLFAFLDLFACFFVCLAKREEIGFVSFTLVSV
jgi:hypothetical protein